MKRRQYEQCIQELVGEVKERGYSMTTIGHLLQFSKSISCRFPNNETDVNVPAAIEAYIDAKEITGVSHNRLRGLKRFARIIKGRVICGKADFSVAQRLHRDPLEDRMESVLEGYRAYLVFRGKSRGTIIKWDSYAYRFLGYLERRGVATMEEVNAAVIDVFVSWVAKLHTSSGLAGELTMLRSLLGFTDDAGLTKNAVSYVPRGKYTHPAPVPAFTSSQIRQILDEVDTTSRQGKRDLAILLLATEMGLRSSDIVKLRLKDINWDKQSLAITQAKTNRPLYLPVPDIVLSAVADYMLNARPKCGFDEVFLVTTHPIRPFSCGPSLHKLTKRYYERAGVLKDGETKAGLHRLRRTYATRLLAAGVAPDRIATALGHAKVENAMSYVEVDVDGLQRCCLDIPEKGGR